MENYRNFIPIKGRANIIELMLKLKKVLGSGGIDHPESLRINHF